MTIVLSFVNSMAFMTPPANTITEAETAAGQEGAHAQFAGLRQRLVIVGLRRIPGGRIAPRVDLTEKAEGPCFVASLVVLAGEREGMLCSVPRFPQAPVAQVGLTKTDDAHGLAVVEKGGMLHGMLEPHHAGGDASGQRERHSEGRLGPGQPDS